MTPEELAAAIEAAKAEGFQAANDRLRQVATSNTFKGREMLATTMLTRPSLATMSADEIIDLMADLPTDRPLPLTDDQRRSAEIERQMQNANPAGVSVH